ncbi:asparagine synthase (glutamine-hydrolyzing) [Castellaniella sp.]|uniref:asparagine synthase (glutamine-hydrolyzing) n=1 Tax=Castellaniella sp. TaxID=1955812 RepID=UPI002AFFE123|nr:asparagine synthase (glutamine-hydrolyzing) [Castellaniella sp.]
MCGFAGILSNEPSRALELSRACLEKMAVALTHRGPDDRGFWQDPSINFSVVHQRLSISDLSSAGHQPMTSLCGRYVLAFNGEIYNHAEIRSSLDSDFGGCVWRGRSDTEVLLTALVNWGLERTLTSIRGMFAFALWDRKQQVLVLARDRMGEKPLYWGWQGRSLLFGSELKALAACPDFNGRVDRGSLALLLRYNYIPAPHSIYQGIHKLPPGHYVIVTLGNQQATPKCYWDYRTVVRKGLDAPFMGAEQQAVDLLESLLTSSLSGQMEADVPLGAFLSGGIDSSLVVALMQQQAARSIHTYAIGFEGKAFDEAPYALAVAKHLGADHTELYVTERDALDVVPNLAHIYCEPFADSSQIPTFLVSRMARKYVTVALTGDGGDELFGGYTPYQFMPKIWRVLRLVPKSLRQGLARTLLHLPVPQKIEKLLSISGALNREELYWRMRSHWLNPESVVRESNEPDSLLHNPSDWRFIEPFETWMMAMDAQDYMIDDVLVKVDRAAMANSLETRVPLLDHRIVEFSASLPLSLKIRSGQGKWILRQLLYKYVPQALVDRPKAGFMVPLGSWLRGPLREWAENLLSEHRLKDGAYFNVTPIRHAWNEHLQGQRDRSGQLWSILMFQAWLEAQTL